MDSHSKCEFLPPDMQFEILSRTALQSLDKCKAVSKDWKQIVSSSTFMASYTKITGNVVGYLVQSLVHNKHLHKFVSPNKPKRSFDISPFKLEGIKIEASSPQGILCCSRMTRFNYRYYVSKPCTNQWQALPNPKDPPCSTLKVALVVTSSTPLHYKIFRLSNKPRLLRLDCYDYRCQIFDSKTWAWKEVEDVLLSKENWFRNNPAVYASGLVCFLTNDYVLAFCLDQETPFTISLPAQSDQSKRKKIVDYQGQLGLLCEGSGEVELWVLKEWKNNISKWEIMKKLNMAFLAKGNISYICPEGFFNGEIALMKTFFGFLFLDLQDSSFNEIKSHDFIYAGDILPFRSDWEPVNLREKRVSTVYSKVELKNPTRIDEEKSS